MNLLRNSAKIIAHWDCSCKIRTNSTQAGKCAFRRMRDLTDETTCSFGRGRFGVSFLSYDRSGAPTCIGISMVPAPALGDYNNDGKVDAADYVSWRKTNINGAPGYTDWRSNYGNLAGRRRRHAQR